MNSIATNLCKEDLILERYQVFEDGTFKHKQRGTYTKGTKQAHGYMALSIRLDGKIIKVYAHRIVAKALLANPENLPCVNHKDGDKTNNSLANLEWVSFSTNNWHAREQLLNTQQKPVRCLETNEVFQSASAAARALNCKSHSSITNACKGHAKTAVGLHWEYLN